MLGHCWVGAVRKHGASVYAEKLTVTKDVREGEGVHGPLGLSSERKVRIRIVFCISI